MLHPTEVLQIPPGILYTEGKRACVLHFHTGSFLFQFQCPEDKEDSMAS